MRDEHEIGGKIREIVSKVTNIPLAEIDDDTSLTRELELDSLSLLEIAVDVDYAFRLGLPDEQLKGIDCVRDAVELVRRRLEEQAAEPVQTEVA